MILDIIKEIKDIFGKVGNFVEKNYSEPFFWLIIFVVLLVLSLYTISKLANK